MTAAAGPLPVSLSDDFRPVAFTGLPGWREDRHLPAFEAFRRSAFRVLEKPYRDGALGISCVSLAPAFDEARSAAIEDDEAAREFFERHFVPCIHSDASGRDGFVTGFYEPEVEARAARGDGFQVPLLAVPDDLVAVDGTNRPPGMDPSLAFARRDGDGLVPCPDRRAIESGALGDRARPIAWLRDKVDAFFIHVQGAARLAMPDGRVRRITYAAKSGHPFTGVGKVLADLGEIPPAEVTMQSIRAWLAAHPDRVDEILWRNRSYIFFREAEVDDPALGPVAAAKVPLTAGRSIAVDRLLHTFGTPIHVDAPHLARFDGAPFRRLMIAQDTGSAIVGPRRGDLFCGSGAAAGEIAGAIRHGASFFFLVPRPLAGGAA